MINKKPTLVRSWKERARNPSLIALLVPQVFLLFVALPLDATGVPIAEPVAWSLLVLSLLVFMLTVVLACSRAGASQS